MFHQQLLPMCVDIQYVLVEAIELLPDLKRLLRTDWRQLDDIVDLGVIISSEMNMNVHDCCLLSGAVRSIRRGPAAPILLGRLLQRLAQRLGGEQLQPRRRLAAPQRYARQQGAAEAEL